MQKKLERELGQGIVLLQEIIDYLEKHMFDELTIDIVARQFQRSSTLVNQLFHNVLDMTAMEYLRYRRISLAGNDLLTSKLSIIDAALKYGYETPEAFSKAFTRFHGFPPSLVRRIYPKMKEFNPVQLKVEIHGGFEESTTSVKPYRTKQNASEQERNLEYSYNDCIILKGGYSMEQQSCTYHIKTKDMIHKEDWRILLLLVKRLNEAGLAYKVDGKTMIFAHGLEFKLDKICLTFPWEEERKVLDFFDEDGEFSETYPGFKYYDTKFIGMKVRCMMYSKVQGPTSEEALYQYTDLVEIDGVITHVQSLEFYYENAEPDSVYYKLVEDYIKNHS